MGKRKPFHTEQKYHFLPFYFLTPIYNDAHSNPFSSVYNVIKSWSTASPTMKSASADVAHENSFILHSSLEVESAWKLFDIELNIAINSATIFVVIVFVLSARYVIIRYKKYKSPPVKQNIIPFDAPDFCILFCNIII
jgi:beta-lactamase regulating signal transducer with metallopeptidase domain